MKRQSYIYVYTNTHTHTFIYLPNLFSAILDSVTFRTFYSLERLKFNLMRSMKIIQSLSQSIPCIQFTSNIYKTTESSSENPTHGALYYSLHRVEVLKMQAQNRHEYCIVNQLKPRSFRQMIKPIHIYINAPV